MLRVMPPPDPTYLMAGGAPYGIKIPDPDFGCRTNSTKINTTTMQGNKSTTPKGIDTLEFPLNRSGRLKNAHFECTFGLSFSSKGGRLGDVGKRFITRCTKPIGTVVFAVPQGKCQDRGRDRSR